MRRSLASGIKGYDEGAFVYYNMSECQRIEPMFLRAAKSLRQVHCIKLDHGWYNHL